MNAPTQNSPAQIYFDNSATTRVSDRAAAAALRAMQEEYGNPSSVYQLGAKSAHAIQSARETVAAALGRVPTEITFTSGGTEANNIALFGAAQLRGRQANRVIVSAVEHPSVSEAAKQLANRGFAVSFAPVDEAGCVCLDQLEQLLGPDTAVVSIMQVNNETGTVQPLHAVGELVRRLAPQAVFHVDGVQAFARLPVDLPGWQADAYSGSAHKIHGMKGSGFLWLKKDCHLAPLFYGGGQEKGLRSGTENMPGICALAAATAEAMEDREGYLQRMFAVKQALYHGAQQEIADVFLNGQPLDTAAPHILSLSFLGVRSAVLLHHLEQQGICVSAGSACDSRSSKGSPILLSMGLSRERVDSVLRFSFSRYNTVAEAEQTVAVLKTAVAELRQLMAGKKRRS